MSAAAERFPDVDGVDLQRHDPVDLDGVPIAATLAPGDAEALARAVTALAESGLAAIPRGGGCHLHLGNPPARADLFLSTSRLRGLLALEPADGVCRAQAGTPLAELRAAVLEEGWELPLDAPDAASLGGSLAAAALGPRSHGFGPARDAVLGLDVVLGSGEATRCGGRVVKNVTGYDLAKLYTGSFGSLGVIASAWLRLRPVAETTRVLVLAAGSLDAGCELALRAARRGTSRACALHAHAGGGDVEVVVELAGDAAGVASDAQAIGGEDGGAESLARIARRQWSEGAADARRYRIAALPTELPGVACRLHDAGLEVIAYPGLCLVYACFAAERDAVALPAVAAAAASASGPLRCEAAPPELKRRGDVFGASAAEAKLFQALKRRFDPRDALSPGRVASVS